MGRKKSILLALIIAFGLFLRLYGLNWDQGFHLHPDERFLTMVSVDISFPKSLSEYFDRKVSPLNPENNNHAFYVYGLAPVTLNKVIGELLLNTTYDTIHLQGRALSAIADGSIILILFGVVKLLEKKLKTPPSLKYIAAGMYSISVLPIQLSHFFTVDTFMHFFGWLSIYFALSSAIHPKTNGLLHSITSLIFFGFALASKVSAIYYLPPIAASLGLFLFKYFTAHKRIVPILGIIFVWFLSLYISVRIASPYYFNSPHLLDVTLSEQFLHNIRTLKSFEDPNGYFPPAVQWIRAPWYLGPLNIIVFGLGIPYALLALIGFVTSFAKSPIWKWVAVWVGIILLYQSAQFAKTMRYFIVLYPVFAVYAGYGLVWVVNTSSQLCKKQVRSIVIGVIGLSICLWPAAFMSIYTKPHSRVEASRWIYENVANGSTIAWEYWDDPLPLLVPNPKNKQFASEQIGIFDPDSAEKWNRIQKQLLRSDYYIMSSNRGWGSIPTVPERYPLATDFYKDMFAGRRGFSLIAEFTSYPSLRYLGIPLDFEDQWAEEAFTVYDHPKVMIFQKNSR